jgi:hypothetical protein
VDVWQNITAVVKPVQGVQHACVRSSIGAGSWWVSWLKGPTADGPAGVQVGLLTDGYFPAAVETSTAVVTRLRVCGSKVNHHPSILYLPNMG